MIIKHCRVLSYLCQFHTIWMEPQCACLTTIPFKQDNFGPQFSSLPNFWLLLLTLQSNDLLYLCYTSVLPGCRHQVTPDTQKDCSSSWCLRGHLLSIRCLIGSYRHPQAPYLYLPSPAPSAGHCSVPGLHCCCLVLLVGFVPALACVLIPVLPA